MSADVHSRDSSEHSSEHTSEKFSEHTSEEASVDREASTEYRHLYVHIPFCARRCSYCDFAIAVRRITPTDEYLDALAGELAIRRSGAAQDAPLETLYFGGGTPSRLGADGLTRAIRTVRRHFLLSPDAEVTVEANPEDLDPTVVSAWREAGVNRVSLGVQSFDTAVLTWMHRSHDVAGIYRAVEALAAGGIENWSLDLIYALPPEVPRDWARDVALATELAPPHISAYGLSIEGGTPLDRWRERGEVHEADEERFEEDFLVAHDRFAAAGYEHYEVSNWARPGRRSRHNSSYWRNAPYLALGPGAHGYDGVRRRWNEREYARWRERILQGEDPIGGDEYLSQDQQALESLYVGLRTWAGAAIVPGDAVVTDRWIEKGWAVRHDDRLRLSPLGWLRLDALVSALTEHRSRY